MSGTGRTGPPAAADGCQHYYAADQCPTSTRWRQTNKQANQQREEHCHCVKPPLYGGSLIDRCRFSDYTQQAYLRHVTSLHGRPARREVDDLRSLLPHPAIGIHRLTTEGKLTGLNTEELLQLHLGLRPTVREHLAATAGNGTLFLM